MSESRNVEALAFMFGYFMISFVLTFLNGYNLSLWLGINVVLAIIPFILMNNIFIRFKSNENNFDVLTWILLIVFILFLPNTFYVMTDIIHIDYTDFYRVVEGGSDIYYEVIEPYMLLVHVFVSAVIGVYLGVISLVKFNKILTIKISDRYTRGLFFVGVLMLSSVGIYIGRFLRYFSWDVINPFKLIPEIFDSISLFSISFVILFTIIQYLLYYGYKIVTEEKPFE